MQSTQLWIGLQEGTRFISVPGGHALIGATGFFVREIQLPVGAGVVVRFCRGQNEFSVEGTVATSYAGLGSSIEFKEQSALMLQKLAALQESERVRVR
jgi:hypothetical protein